MSQRLANMEPSLPKLGTERVGIGFWWRRGCSIFLSRSDGGKLSLYVGETDRRNGRKINLWVEWANTERVGFGLWWRRGCSIFLSRSDGGKLSLYIGETYQKKRNLNLYFGREILSLQLARVSSWRNYLPPISKFLSQPRLLSFRNVAQLNPGFPPPKINRQFVRDLIITSCDNPRNLFPSAHLLAARPCCFLELRSSI